MTRRLLLVLCVIAAPSCSPRVIAVDPPVLEPTPPYRPCTLEDWNMLINDPSARLACTRSV